jgi:DNA polymerase V
LIAVFSSNYALYADISSRVMQTLEVLHPPRVEEYSIDEAFLDLSGFDPQASLENHGRRIRRIVGRHVGVPV